MWLRYGSRRNPRQILIDAGRSATYKKDLRHRLLALPESQRTFELFVITHVDRDHIEGAMALLEDRALPITFKQIWFNGYDHLVSAKLETFGAVQGERVTAALLNRKRAWNKSWKAKAVALRRGKLTKAKLAGGMTLTLLSPDRQKLLDLIPTWEQECKDAGLIPGKNARRKEQRGLEEFGAIDVEALASTKFEADVTKPNGSSIALLAEYRGKRALLGADAHVDRLLSSLKSLAKGKKRIELDLFKIPHHGSEGNISRELLEALDCSTYLISTNGSYFKHPKAVALARVLKFGGASKVIAFNYRSRFTDIWGQPALQSRYKYRAIYPHTKRNGTLVLTLLK